MSGTTVSVRIDRRLRMQMRQYEDVNWSAVLRQSLRKELEQRAAESRAGRRTESLLGRQGRFDKKRALEACAGMDRMRESGVFSLDRRSEEIVREWRQKRR